MHKSIYTRHVSNDCVLSFFTFMRKSKFNLPELYDHLDGELSSLNRSNNCHLSTYPFIAVHVVNGDAEYLKKDFERIEARVQSALEFMQK